MPILTNPSRHVTGYDKGEGPHGTLNGSIHFGDTHPLVKWLDAILDHEDIIEEIHAWSPSSHADDQHRDGHQAGFTWVVGRQIPGLRVEQP